jgi:hypothetical protein
MSVPPPPLGTPGMTRPQYQRPPPKMTTAKSVTETKIENIPMDKRKWSVIRSLDEVFSVMTEYGFKNSEVLVSLDFDGTISGRHSRKTHTDSADRTLDQEQTQEVAIMFLRKLADLQIAFFINTAATNPRRPDDELQGHISKYIIPRDYKFPKPQLLRKINCTMSANSALVLAAGYMKDIPINDVLTPNIKLVIHVDDAFINIHNVLFAPYKGRTDVCIHGLFFPTVGTAIGGEPMLADMADNHEQLVSIKKFLRATQVKGSNHDVEVLTGTRVTSASLKADVKTPISENSSRS